MLDLYFQLRGGRAERVSVGDNIDAAILAFRGDERRVVTHCPQQGGDQILKLVGVLFDDILPNAFRCLTLQHIQIIGLIRILLDDRYRVLFLYLGKLAVKIGEELSGSGGKSFRTLFRQMPNPALFDEIPDLAYLYRIEVEIRFPADDTALGFLFLIIGQRER